MPTALPLRGIGATKVKEADRFLYFILGEEKMMRTKRLMIASALLSLVLFLSNSVLAGPTTITVGTPFEVKCPVNGKKIGTITIDVYKNTSGAGWYSTEIKGGFDKTADPCPPMPGTSYYWVQAVKGKPALYGWQNTTDWYIDRTRKPDDPATPKDESKIVADGSPFYANRRGPDYGHTTLGYYDEPCDDRLPIDLYFETALVCSYDKKICCIDAFTWGYEVTGGAAFTLKALSHTGSVSNNLINAFKKDPDPMFGAWSIDRCCCCVPDPASLILALVGLGTVAMLRRRKALR